MYIHHTYTMYTPHIYTSNTPINTLYTPYIHHYTVGCASPYASSAGAGGYFRVIRIDQRCYGAVLWRGLLTKGDRSNSKHLTQRTSYTVLVSNNDIGTNHSMYCFGTAGWVDGHRHAWQRWHPAIAVLIAVCSVTPSTHTLYCTYSLTSYSSKCIVFVLAPLAPLLDR